jgi:hypothetical protein
MHLGNRRRRANIRRGAIVAVLSIAAAASIFQVGNRTVLRPSDVSVDVTSDLSREIIWTGGACVDLQVRTAWWGWRTIAQGTIDGNGGAEWSETGSWHFLTNGFRQTPCIAVKWLQVPVPLPVDALPGLYRLCDSDGTCTTVDLRV